MICGVVLLSGWLTAIETVLIRNSAELVLDECGSVAAWSISRKVAGSKQNPSLRSLFVDKLTAAAADRK